MRAKATVIAPANIAFIKYWGTADWERTLPFNPSLSMTLRECVTRTTVEVLSREENDSVSLMTGEGSLEPAAEAFTRRVVPHLERLREWSGEEVSFRVATENSFPMGAGMASSASGFAALTLAVVAALGKQVSSEEASVLARLSGSGSAARSVEGGYVKWPAGEGNEGEHAVQVATADHWDLRDVVAVLQEQAKDVSSREGHERAPSSPYFEPRQRLLPDRLETATQAILTRDFAALAHTVEEEAIDLHLIAMSSHPPIFYWRPGTLEVLAAIRRLRQEGAEVCATMDAGANVHMICTPESEAVVAEEIGAIPEVSSLIHDGVGRGPMIVDEHLI
jgi:diphosphomevalonate decarboxylase